MSPLGSSAHAALRRADSVRLHYHGVTRPAAVTFYMTRFDALRVRKQSANMDGYMKQLEVRA